MHDELLTSVEKEPDSNSSRRSPSGDHDDECLAKGLPGMFCPDPTPPEIADGVEIMQRFLSAFDAVFGSELINSEEICSAHAEADIWVTEDKVFLFPKIVTPDDVCNQGTLLLAYQQVRELLTHRFCGCSNQSQLPTNINGAQ